MTLIVEIKGYLLSLNLSIVLDIEVSIQMLFVEKIQCATKAKPAGNSKS